MKCKTCNGNGARIAFNDNKARFELQRCDTCEFYNDDVDAWLDLNPEIVHKPFNQTNQ